MAIEYAHKALELGSSSAQKVLSRAMKKQKKVEDAKDKGESTTGHSENIDLKTKKISLNEQSLLNSESEENVKIKKDYAREEKKASIQRSKKEVTTKPDEDDSATIPKETLPSNESSVADNYTVNEYFAMGLAASERQEFEQAIEYFTKVTEMIPNASSSFLNLANLFYNLKDYDTARTHAQRALDLGSKSAQRLLDDIDATTKSPA